MVADPPPKPSWVSVAQGKGLRKYDVEVSDLNGQKSVEVPIEITENSSPLWEDFVLGIFLDTAPHVAKVHVILNKIWSFGDKTQKIDVIEVDSKTMRFRITNPMVKQRVLKRGMWNIADVPMVVSKWTPIIEESAPEEVSIPLWVHLTKVSMNMFSWEGLSFITNAVGGPVRLHPETAVCTTFDVAKVFVSAELAKGFPKSINFTIQGKPTCVEFTYPWLPSRCEKCGKWGHIDTNCGKKDQVKESESSSKKEVEEEKDKQNTLTKNPEEKESGKEMEIKTPEVKSNSEKEDMDTEIEEVQIANEWLTPGKTGRGTSNQRKNLKYEETQIISPSRFSALSVPDEEIQEMEKSG